MYRKYVCICGDPILILCNAFVVTLYMILRMYLKLTFQSKDYSQKQVVCRVTGGDPVVFCSYLGPYDSAVITNDTPGLRHENPSVLPRFSSSATASH